MRFSFKQTKFAAAAMAALALLLAVGAQAKADFINGGFEQAANGGPSGTPPGGTPGSFYGWTESGNFTASSYNEVIYGGEGGSLYTPHSGNYFPNVGAVTTLGYLSQNVPTTIGHTYTVSLWVECDGTSPSELTIVYGGTVTGTNEGVQSDGGTLYSGTVTGGTTLLDLKNFGPFGYTQESVSFTATDSTTNIAFGFRDDPGFFALDDLSYAPSGPATAPEPSSFILFGVGAAGLLGYAGLRRRMQPVPVA